MNVLWICLVGFMMHDSVSRARSHQSQSLGQLMLPVRCTQRDGTPARGTAGFDFVRSLEEGKPWSQDTCWYELSKFRALYPEYNDLSDSDLAAKMYAAIGRTVIKPSDGREAILQAVSIALLPPLGLLLFGAALGWVLAGFSRSHP
jgi:hypothetical protein